MGQFAEIAEKFRAYHTNSLNVALHMVTTPMGIVAALIALRQNLAETEYAYEALVGAYVVSLLFTLKNVGLWFATAAWMGGLVVVADQLAPSFDAYATLKLLAAGYVGQELAHLITNEKTFQSSYQFKSLGWPALLLEHTYYLLPLCLDALVHMRESFASWIVAHNYVVRAKLTSAKDTAALRVIKNFVTKEDPDRTCTAHWWHVKLADKEKEAFSHIVHSEPIEKMFADRFRPDAWVVKPVYGMNEIYVASSHHNKNSDTVFYMEHCDGPWAVYPFCFLYRCMLAVNENVKVETIFTHEGSRSCLSDGDVVGFDFHREIHVIADKPVENPDRRITMKLHYCVYPKCFGIFGEALLHLSVMYNTVARRLFLNTIHPTGIWRFMAFMVLTVTNAVFLVSKYAGFSNIASVAALYAAGKFIHPYFFFAMTSYTHYCMYIATYHVRDRINFGMFKRNVIFWKTLALTHLAVNYLRNFQFDPVSLAMIVLGYGLSTSAVVALGVDQTYFGVELGEVKPNFVDCFPYNSVPHPMIIGSMVGLLGIQKMAGFRAALPYAIPMHCTMYFIHMLQEQLNDIYAANWAGATTKVQKTSTRTARKTPSTASARTPVRKSPRKTPSRKRAMAVA